MLPYNGYVYYISLCVGDGNFDSVDGRVWNGRYETSSYDMNILAIGINIMKNITRELGSWIS